MLIPDTVNAPRLCRAADRFFFVRKIDYEGWGILLNWLDDVLPGERKELPKVGDEASQKAINSWPGVVLLTWLALREHGVTYEEAASTYAFRAESVDLESEDGKRQLFESVHLFNCFFGRRRTAPKNAGLSGKDISELWCGKGMAELAIQYGIERIAKLTIDQISWLFSGGSLDEEFQWGDLQAIQDELPARIAAIEAARAASQLEIPPSTP